MFEPSSAGQGPPSRRFEISAVILTALGALALVSLLSDAAGIIGTWLSVFLRYLFGQLAVVPPVMLIVHALLSLRYGAHVQYTRRALAVVSLYFVALTVMHLVAGEILTFQAIGAFSANSPGGGILGAIIATVLVRAVGRGGSWIVIAAWTAISAILISETPLSRFLARVFGVLARLGKGLALGWGDFWRGVRAEFAELVALIRDRRELRRERAALAHAENDVPGRPGRARRKKNKMWARRKTRHASDEVPLTAPVAAATADADSGIDGDTPPVASDVTVDEESTIPVLAEASDDGDDTASPAASRSRRPARTVGGAEGTLAVATEAPAETPVYRLPPLALLERPKVARGRTGRDEPDQSAQLEETLARFGIEAKVVHVSRGPVVTRYELQPAPGVKVKQITSLADDLALALAAAGIRIEAPVPGKSVVGIEVPNKETSPVYLREVLESEAFGRADSKLVIGLGKDITGNPVVADLRKLLHVLIAGATGSGKSVCINSIVVSLLYKAMPHEVKLLMIDPKRVELAVYDGIPHLVTPVVTDPKQAATALRWAVKEMDNRYTRFSEVGVRNIDGYNRWALAQTAEGTSEEEGERPEPLPYIVVIIDELADLMMVAQHDVEDSISRLAQMARAAGIHLIIATQRPSVDVITGLIKANVPSRISFAVSSSHDSRTILDMAGAERLLGKGDMLYYPTGSNKPIRAQGAFVSDKEVQEVVSFWKAQGEPVYDEEVVTAEEHGEELDEIDDELYEDAVRLVMENDSASISMLQRRFRIGYSRAARLIDMMELRGIVGPYQGSKPREVLRRTIDTE